MFFELNMVSHCKVRTQVEGGNKAQAEENIYTQERASSRALERIK
jgi:hypothetical protein